MVYDLIKKINVLDYKYRDLYFLRRNFGKYKQKSMNEKEYYLIDEEGDTLVFVNIIFKNNILQINKYYNFCCYFFECKLFNKLNIITVAKNHDYYNY
jgi:hypothetical protein